MSLLPSIRTYYFAATGHGYASHPEESSVPVKAMIAILGHRPHIYHNPTDCLRIDGDRDLCILGIGIASAEWDAIQVLHEGGARACGTTITVPKRGN